MSHYAIFDVTITDLEKYQDYMMQVKPVIEAAGGRYLVRGGALIRRAAADQAAATRLHAELATYAG